MTTMVDIDGLLPFVMPSAPSCPEPTALRHLREACREFCQKALVWREYSQFTITTPASQAIAMATDVAIVRIEQAYLDDVELEPQTVGWLDEHVPDWNISTGDTGPGRYVAQLTPETVTIVPQATGLLKIRLVLKPTRAALTIPSFLIEDYGQQIGYGAAGKVLMTPNAEFTNPQLGLALTATFNDWVTSMNREVARGQQRGKVRTKAQYF